MDGKIDKVREALETLCEALELALARLGVCGQGDGADHKADADSIGGTNALTMGRAALSTLSSIDPEAIRREALQGVREEIEKWRDDLTCGDYDEGYLDGTDNALKIIDAAVLSAEPAQDEGKAEEAK